MKNLIFLLLLLPLIAWSQEKTYTIEISAESAHFFSSKFNISISKGRNNVKIVYRRWHFEGSAIDFYRDSIMVDSMIIGLDDKYTNFLDDFYATDTDSLLHKEQNKTRYVIDGTGVRIIRKSGEGIMKDIKVRSPTSKSHPEIVALITTTLNLYRGRFPDSPLSKKKFTGGY